MIMILLTGVSNSHTGVKQLGTNRFIGKEQQANDFLVALKFRLTEYGLSVNEDKTAIINLVVYSMNYKSLPQG